MVKPDAVDNMGHVVQAVEAAGFTIRCAETKSCCLSPALYVMLTVRPCVEAAHGLLEGPDPSGAKRCTCCCSQLRLCRLSRAEVEHFYAVHRGKPFYERLTEFMSSGHVLAMELVAEGAACSMLLTGASRVQWDVASAITLCCLSPALVSGVLSG